MTCITNNQTFYSSSDEIVCPGSSNMHLDIWTLLTCWTLVIVVVVGVCACVRARARARVCVCVCVFPPFWSKWCLILNGNILMHTVSPPRLPWRYVTTKYLYLQTATSLAKSPCAGFTTSPVRCNLVACTWAARSTYPARRRQ